jgi:prepilin-type N-terminal cleavage/methylation domain-containing protein
VAVDREAGNPGAGANREQAEMKRPSRQQRPASRGRRGGFTLLELLVVIGIIAVLCTVLISGARYVVYLARQRRFEATARSLETALTRYRSEYNRWPMGSAAKRDDYIYVAETPAENASVFNMLRESNAGDNPKGIRFLDESSLLTVDSSGRRIPLARAGKGAHPIVYAGRESNKTYYFRVVFNVENDTVSVGKDKKDDE